MDFQNLFDYFVFDLDGVIYSGEKAIGNSPEVLETLRKNKKEIRFITNNPSQSPSDYAEKLRRLGIHSHDSEFVTSPMATASLIRGNLSSEKWKTVFIAGSDYLKNEVRKTVEWRPRKKPFWSETVSEPTSPEGKKRGTARHL